MTAGLLDLHGCNLDTGRVLCSPITEVELPRLLAPWAEASADTVDEPKRRSSVSRANGETSWCAVRCGRHQNPEMGAERESRGPKRVLCGSARSVPYSKWGSLMARRFSGAQLRTIRTGAGVEVERLALELGRSGYTVAGYELGKITPPSDVVGMLADLFGVSVDALFSDVEMAGAA